MEPNLWAGTWLVVCLAGVFDLLGEQRKMVLDPQQMWPKRNGFNCLARAKIHTPSLGWIQGIQPGAESKETCQQIRSEASPLALHAGSRALASPSLEFSGGLCQFN